MGSFVHPHDLRSPGDLAPRVGFRAVTPTKVVKDPQALKNSSWAFALRGQGEVNSNHVPTSVSVSGLSTKCECKMLSS